MILKKHVSTPLVSWSKLAIVFAPKDPATSMVFGTVKRDGVIKGGRAMNVAMVVEKV